MLDILRSFNNNLTEKQFNLLRSFKELLYTYNKKYNLTSILGESEFYIRHICDSIAGEKFFDVSTNAAEIGSGGGFPSIPLKIVRPDIKFTLIESVGKKCVFLKTAAQELSLSDVSVLNGRAEDFSRQVEYRETFNAVCARAVAPLNTLCEYCAPFVKVGGKFIAYKTNNQEELDGALNASQILGLKLKEVYKYELPMDMGSRSIIVYEKIRATPPKYPRGQGKERSKPL